jgi:hypothetical protein
VDALSVIPDGCLVYLNTTDFLELNQKINSQSLVIDKLKLLGDVNRFCNTIQAFDSVFTSHELLVEEMTNNPIHFAYYEQEPGWLAAFNIKRLGNEGTVRSALAELLDAKLLEGGSYEFTIYKNTACYFFIHEGVVLVSDKKERIGQGLSANEPKLENNKAYIRFRNTLSENNLLSVFVNHSLYSESKAASAVNLSYACKRGYSAGAIDFQPSQVKINGFLDPDSSEIICFFRDQQPQASEDIASYLPDNTVAFRAYGFSSLPALEKKLKQPLVVAEFWTQCAEAALYNLQAEFNANAGNRLIGFRTAAAKERFVSLEIQDTLKAAEHLRLMSDTIMTYTQHFIYRLSRDHGKSSLRLFEPLLTTQTHYATVYQSRIFFSESAESLSAVLSDLAGLHLLSDNESFTIYKNQHFPDEYNYLIYSSPNQMKEEIGQFFNFGFAPGKDPYGTFKHLSFSITNHPPDFKFRFQLTNESESRTKDKNVLWTLNLDTTSHMTPSGFINHNTRDNELVVQDDNHTLYLINAKGTVLWRKKLNEKILSEIYLTDIYKKEKYQMLFNTKNYLHLIDRNGKYVDGYPVKLPAAATSPLSVFDYDGDKDYRLLIACENNQIYNYSIHGVPQEKFIPVKTENRVDLPIQYVKVGPSDYLVALDREGKIYTFSRKGVGRIGLRNRTVANCQAFYADAGNTINSTYLIYVDDKNGLINKVSFGDKKEIVKLNSEIENASVNFSLVDDNRNMDLIVTKENSIQAYNFSGNMITEKSMPIPLYKSNFYRDESHSLFYSLGENRNEITVFDQLKQKTRVLKGSALPMISNLFGDNKKYLVITNGKQVSCILLN